MTSYAQHNERLARALAASAYRDEAAGRHVREREMDRLQRLETRLARTVADVRGVVTLGEITERDRLRASLRLRFDAVNRKWTHYNPEDDR